MESLHNGFFVQTDTVILHGIWREALNRLHTLSRRVQEGKDVLAASEFARYLFFSRTLELLEANPQPEPLKVDGSFLRWKCQELISDCNERFRTNNLSPNFKASELQSLHDKLDKVAGYLSQLSSSPAVVARTPDGAVESSSQERNGNNQNLVNSVMLPDAVARAA